MLKQLQMGLRAFMLLASKVWSCFCYMFKKQYRAVNINSYAWDVVCFLVFTQEFVCLTWCFNFSWLSTNLSSMKYIHFRQYLDTGWVSTCLFYQLDSSQSSSGSDRAGVLSKTVVYEHYLDLNPRVRNVQITSFSCRLVNITLYYRKYYV